ncbi:MAG: glutamate formimidoyltransferase [Betaproteobacteria bacterium RIFCSPLOWO2_12_FULL_64_23]|nr:MAG: glutamate formimidoyltransferase [Betaproteobacteria bacterium RIFCSPLOWO2_12_FULL_64_23]
MTHRVVECVPNFSEGRDLVKMRRITDAIESVSGVKLLHVDPGADTNRTVVTFVGDPDSVVEAAFRGIAAAAKVIDMRRHTGAHPRVGACDVCPFVPVEGVDMDDCVELARRLGERVGRELEVPVYLYEHAASRPARTNLALVRKGEYEGLEQKLADPEWKPDFGPARFNPAFGALITGAREFLIAYNINLNSTDKAHATDIALELREKGRVARRGQKNAYYSSGQELRYTEDVFPCGNCAFDGKRFEDTEQHCQEAHGYSLRDLLALNDIDAAKGVLGRKVYRAGLFKACKAIGWYVDAYKRVQLSINLTNWRATSPRDVLEAARNMATARGLVVTGSEIVGLVPFQALYQAGRAYLEAQGKSPYVPVNDVLQAAMFSLGLNDVAPFALETKVLGLPKAYAGGLMDMRCRGLVDEVSRGTPAPGGGSVAALAGSLGAALASMVANLTQGKAASEMAEKQLRATAEKAQRVKDALMLAVDEDAFAFSAYMNARRLPAGTAAEKAHRDAKMQEGLKLAVEVPLRTARLSYEAMETAELAMRDGNPNSITDAMVGFTIASAGVRGGIWNVLINLKDLADAAFVAEMRPTCAKLLAKTDALLARATSDGNARLEAMLLR